MVIRFLILLISLTLLLSCASEIAESERNNILTENFQWESHKDFFKYAKLKAIDFNSIGTPIQSIDNLKKVENKFKGTNFKHFLDSSWISSTEIFYYGTIEFQGMEQPVFLSVRDFDGLSYHYHLVNFNSAGEIVQSWIIAYSWQAAECIGYDRLYIENDLMISETLGKCYDAELSGEQRIDSIRDIAPLTTFGFKKDN